VDQRRKTTGQGTGAGPLRGVARAEPQRWRIAGFEEMELLRGRKVSEEYPRHWHEEIYLCATMSGVSHSPCLGRTLSAGPGQLALIAPGDVHSNWKTECTYRCLLIEPRTLRSKMQQYFEHKVPELNFRSGVVEHAGLFEAFLEVHREGERCEVGGHQRLMAFFSALAAGHGQRPIAEPRGEDRAVEHTKRYLEECYAEPVPLRELARMVGLSEYHLNRSFRRKIGMPPHEYQLQVRIMKAKLFLRLRKTLSETAALVGFVDQSHFTRHFKRSVGVTPGQFSGPYRKQL
jgi:AraC-like DNA-binding protein